MADATMSIDNILAIAAASGGDVVLLGLGLLLSIPLVVGGASVISTVIDRFPVLAWGGAALLGWIAGEMMAQDPTAAPYLASHEVKAAWAALAGMTFVLSAGAGVVMRRRRQAAKRQAWLG